ncbi:MAG TPA: thioredoxin-dependent thiol peroxidase [Chitinophagaceae bacterium]|jgi:peroxiredoxin Q/BCP|nr:thioredoxin-dependent thiol peroxidase [Chitinophagaceae bacterium]
MITLKEGDKAPPFTSKDQDGNKISLSDYKGKKLILYFYSEAGSPTCTIESCNLRDNYALLKKKGFEVIGVSPDDEKTQKKFEAKYKLPFPLLADTSHDVLEKYGVWDQKKLFGREYMGVLRTTFVINEKGIIEKIFTRPKNKAHAQEIVASMKK